MLIYLISTGNNGIDFNLKSGENALRRKYFVFFEFCSTFAKILASRPLVQPANASVGRIIAQKIQWAILRQKVCPFYHQCEHSNL